MFYVCLCAYIQCTCVCVMNVCWSRYTLFFSPSLVSTPDAIHSISESIRMQTQPLPKRTFSSETKLPPEMQAKTASKRQSATKTAPHMQTSRSSTETVQFKKPKGKLNFSQHSTSSSTSPHIRSKLPVRTTGSKSSTTTEMKSTKTFESTTKPRQKVSLSKPSSTQQHSKALDETGGERPVSSGTRDGGTPPLLQSMPRAHEILAEQIAAAVATGSESSDSSLHTPEKMLHAVTNPVAAMGEYCMCVCMHALK